MLFDLQRAHRIMAKEGIDALVATSPDNVTYISGYWAMSHWARPGGPQAYAVLPAPGASPCLIAGSGNLDHVVDGESRFSEAYRYGFFATRTDGPGLSGQETQYAALLHAHDFGDPAAALLAALRERKLEGSRIAIEDTGMQPAVLARVREELPQAQIVSGAKLLRALRTIKTPEEVERLRGAVRATERGIVAALRIARPGIAERELRMEFDRTVITEGGIPVSSMCIGGGAHSAMSNCQAGERKLVAGEVIRFDGGVRYKWYRSDIARIGALGDPGERVRSYYGALREGAERGIAAIRPGVRTAEIFRIAMETVRKVIPHYERSHVGHGIGINNYDAPDLAPKSDEVFEEGMVVCVETPYYELGWAGLQLENTMVVRADGAELLTSLDNELRIQQA
ncbi:MAG: aminopeptidase P family protein [Betaproteobacteria bacterium]|nr:aminopeptidase P family protein [Betaproteobacteria bacterium]